ncbi:MAG: Uma2 family endonuclease [Firmicutes bacterium]|nr:Uma2 family endonuclease [Bacillota bacterium]
MGSAFYDYEDPGPEITADLFFEIIDLPENQNKTYELIDGYIIAMSGNTTPNHQRISGCIAREIGNYLKGKKCEVFQELNVYLFKEDIGKCKNVFQPDVLICCDKSKLTDRGCEGTPEFIVEVISASTSWRDYSVKLKRYMDFGVKEYWIVDMFSKQIMVYKSSGDNPPACLIYTFADKVRVGVLEDLEIDFREISETLG